MIGKAALRQQGFDILLFGQGPQLLKRRRLATDYLAQPTLVELPVERAGVDRVLHGDLVAPVAHRRRNLSRAGESNGPLGRRPAGEHCDTSHFSPPDRGS